MDKADEKENPGFLIGLQIAYIFIWVLFISLSILILEQVRGKFESLKSSLDYASFPSEYSLLMSQSSSSASLLEFGLAQKDKKFFLDYLSYASDSAYALQKSNLEA